MTTKTFSLTKKHAAKIVSLVDRGLTKGVGEPEPGKMCIMAVFNYTLGRPHGDEGLEDCVGPAVRAFDIALNDSDWSSNEARAKGMRRESVAKIGSNTIDQNVFVKELVLATVRKIVPFALRAAAGMKANIEHKAKLEECAVDCENVKTIDAARYAASYAARYAASAARYAAREAASAASDAAREAASAARYAASDAASAASYAAREAASAARYAASYAAREAASAAKDKVLTMMAEIAVEALQKAGSPGCKWLDLCE